MDSRVRIQMYHRQLMTLPSKAKRLTSKEIESIEIALNDADIRAIHPEKMEAFAEYLVERMKQDTENK